jgi:hypothetical protein
MDHPELPTVELHWRVSWYEEDFSKDLLERARPAADGLLEPDPVDEAASLLLYYARDGFFGLRLAADLAAWCDRHAPPPGGGLLDGCARRYPQLARVWCAAAAALSRVSRIPATTWLTSPPRLGRRATLAVRLATWSQRGDEDQLRSNISLVDGLLTPPRSLDRFMIRLMTDDPEHVPSHVTKRMARFATGLWAVRREPWDPVPADV